MSIKKAAVVFFLMLPCLLFQAAGQQVRDVLVDVTLTGNGSARISETWDVEAVNGTEWYLVRENLGDISIRNLQVSENGGIFTNEGEWDTSRNLEEKKSRCGLIHKSNGVEICWGLGRYGDHIFSVSYEMTCAVKSLPDYDCFHVQLVSPGLSSPPQHVKAIIRTEETPLNDTNARIWGFGFEGECRFCDGEIIYESSERFQRNSSVTALVRLNKGILQPESTRDCSFDQVLDMAMEGSSYPHEEEESWWEKIMAFLMTALLPAGAAMIAILNVRHEKRKILGDVKEKDVDWFRDPPYEGNPVCTYHILGKLGEIRKSNSLASALILKMIYNGNLSVGKDSKGKIEISFNDSVPRENLPGCARGLYAMMKEASGKDHILQDKEFSRWSAWHSKTVLKWVESIDSEAFSDLVALGCRSGNKYTPEGQRMAREAVGFRKYLKDFTLVREKTTPEVILWKDYLVFASLFGIADKVASELKDIDPKAFDDTLLMDYTTMRTVLYMSDNLARSITHTSGAAAASAASRGMGGRTSFGGGGGFSGGGFGGGCR